MVGEIDKNRDVIDLDGNGMIDESEAELHRAKMQTQRRIAFIALLVLCFSGIYMTVWLPLDRLAAIAAALDWFWVSLSGIIAAYMGAEAWVSRK